MTGLALLGVGALLSVVWVGWVLTERTPSPRGWDILMWVAACLLLFVPPMLAGWIFLQVARRG